MSESLVQYNKEHAANIDYVNTAIINAYDKLKIWVTTNADKLDYVERVIQLLHTAYRGGSFDSAMEGANLITQSVVDITSILREAGVEIDENDTFDTYALKIKYAIAGQHEVCILGKSNTRYSAEEWLEYKQEHDIEPEQDKVILITTPYISFIIGLPLNDLDIPIFNTRPWGNGSDNVSILIPVLLSTFINVLNNELVFSSLENTYRMLLWHDPEVLPHTDYDPNDPSKLYDNYGCVRFSTKLELLASGVIMDSTQLVYIVTTDESDSDASDNCYYWNGTSYVKRFQVPRVANNITGSPAAKLAWEFKAWSDDPNLYCLPSYNVLAIILAYKNEINECLDAVLYARLPYYIWGSDQGNVNTAFHLDNNSNIIHSSASYDGQGYKANANSVVPIAIVNPSLLTDLSE